MKMALKVRGGLAEVPRMRVLLAPVTATLGSSSTLVKLFNDAQQERDPLKIDCTHTKFFDPFGAALLAALLAPKQAIAERFASLRERTADGARGGRTSAADRRSDDSFELCVVGRLSFVKGSSVS